jgi:hypothetical protein
VARAAWLRLCWCENLNARALGKTSDTARWLVGGRDVTTYTSAQDVLAAQGRAGEVPAVERADHAPQEDASHEPPPSPPEAA